MSELGKPVIVVPPELGFAELRAKLEEAGWLLGHESQEAPLVPGEPHWCTWWHRAGDATIRYGFNPVVRLRVLEFEGSHAAVARAAVGDVVPMLDERRLRDLIDAADDERAVLLGLLAVAELGPSMVGVADRVRARLDDERPRVAAAAAEAAAAIVPPVAGAALQEIAAAARPEQSLGFSAAGPPSHKRQILRWLAHDFDGSSAAIDQVLRTALLDDDPEVRVTAAVVAARLGATAVVPALEAAVFPEDRGAGADPREGRLYHLLREVAVEYLKAVARGGPSGNRTAWPVRVRGLLGDLPVTDEMTLLVHALVTPVTIEPADAVDAVAGVVRAGMRWKLAVEGRELAVARVGAVPHWVGHGGEVAPPNPLRRVACGGLWMLARAWREPDAVADWRGTLTEAEELGRRCARVWKVGVRLPRAEEWELALRGPDGRLYPWGNNLARSSRGLPSPWGAVPPAGPEWAVEGGTGIVVGDERPQPCAFRRSPVPGEVAGVRFVIGP